MLMQSMNTIHMNGGDKIYTQEGAFRELYKNLTELKTITQGLRAKKNLYDSIKIWKMNTSVGKTLSTKIGRFIAYALLLFMVLASIHALGFNSFDPVKIFINILEFIDKII